MRTEKMSYTIGDGIPLPEFPFEQPREHARPDPANVIPILGMVLSTLSLGTMSRVQGGDRQAFAELVRRHSASVFRLALSVLGREFVPEAEDVAQEVFL
jgi:hypothetical protein